MRSLVHPMVKLTKEGKIDIIIDWYVFSCLNHELYYINFYELRV